MAGQAKAIAARRVRTAPPTAGPFASPSRRSVLVVSAAAVILSFFPYASIPVSTAYGLQATTALLALLAVLRPATVGVRRVAWMVIVLVVPYLLSVTLGTWFENMATPDIALKSVVTLGLAMATMLVAPVIVAQPSRLGLLLAAVVVAVAVHSSAAIVQAVSFRQGTFPFAQIFALNPSFASFKDIASDYALYVARVFGLFPEPSAMAATLGPWLLFVVVVLRRRRTVAPRSWVISRGSVRLLLWACVAAGTVLIAVSRSSYALPFAGLLMMTLMYSTNAGASAAAQRWRGLVVTGLVLVGGYAVVDILGGRASAVNHSFLTRAQSLSFGVSAWLDSGMSSIVGVGPGQSPGLVTASFQTQMSAATDRAAIYSFLLRYIAESGVLGLAAMVGMVALCAVTMHRSTGARGGYLVLAGWTVSFGTATSYEGLLALWVLAGVMLLWDHLFPGPQPPPRSTPGTMGRSRTGAARRTPSMSSAGRES